MYSSQLFGGVNYGFSLHWASYKAVSLVILNQFNHFLLLMWILEEDQLVILRVTLIYWATMLPLGITGSLWLSFIPAQRVDRIIKLPSLFCLCTRKARGNLGMSLLAIGRLKSHKNVCLRLSLAYSLSVLIQG